MSNNRGSNEKLVETTTGEYRMCCPFCESRLLNKPVKERPDTKYHLYINPKQGFYFCHRCEAKGKANDLKQHLHTITEFRDYKDIIQDIKSKNKIRKTTYTYFNPDTLGTPIVEGTPSWAYLTKRRNLTAQQIRYYDLRSGIDEMAGRIVIPVFDENGDCIYYSGRSYGNAFPKYKNTAVDKKNIVFNLHGVKTDYVIVCEGMFSAIHAGYSAVAVLGKYISKWQFSAIGGRWKKVYLALDGDVLRQDEDLPDDKKKIPPMVKRFQSMGCAVGVVPLPRKDDPEDVGSETFKMLVAHTKLISKTSANPSIKIPSQRRFYKK